MRRASAGFVGLHQGVFVLGTPVCNVGMRQQGRLAAEHVAHVGYDSDEIGAVIDRKLAHGRYEPSHIYFLGRANASQAIVDVLASAGAGHAEAVFLQNGINRRFVPTAHLKVTGIITARGGSKGIPGKNLKLLAGKPLLAYTIEAARASEALDWIILSTEDHAIADAGRAMW